MLLRPRAMAGVIFATGLLAVGPVVAEPLDKEACANLQIERKKLLTRDMQAAIEGGAAFDLEQVVMAVAGHAREFAEVAPHTVLTFSDFELLIA